MKRFGGHPSLQIYDESLKGRRKIRGDLRRILKENGFKRSFFRNPKSEAYTKGGIKAVVRSWSKNNPPPVSLGYMTVAYGHGGVMVNFTGRTNVEYFREVERDLNRYEQKHYEPRDKNGLTGKMLAFTGIFMAGIALSLFSITPTGNAIGSLTGTPQGLLGVFLFIFGLAGIFFSSKK